jgi:hypothetical protein
VQVNIYLVWFLAKKYFDLNLSRFFICFNQYDAYYVFRRVKILLQTTTILLALNHNLSTISQWISIILVLKWGHAWYILLKLALIADPNKRINIWINSQTSFKLMVSPIDGQTQLTGANYCMGSRNVKNTPPTHPPFPLSPGSLKPLAKYIHFCYGSN